MPNVFDEFMGEEGNSVQLFDNPAPQAEEVKQPQEPVQNAPVATPTQKKSKKTVTAKNVSMTNNASTEKNLEELMNIKDFYTQPEWDNRYNIYITECGKIQTDVENLTASQIVISAGRIDNLITSVRVDYANIHAKLNVCELKIKTAYEKAFGDVYNDYVNKGGKIPAIDDRKAMATSLVKAIKSQEEGLDLYSLKERYLARSCHIEGILKVLQDKKDLLITYSAALKIENTANNLSASVPTDNQINSMKN